MNLAGNAEERRGCWRDGVLKASCQPASAARKTTSHATSQAKPARSWAVAPHTAPCNLVSKAHSVTGCRPIKKLKNKFSYVSELPTKFVFIFFAWLVVFVKKSACIMEKGMVD